MAQFNEGKPDVVFMAHTYRALAPRHVDSYQEGIAFQSAVIAPPFVEVSR
jgi:hypothetical protein